MDFTIFAGWKSLTSGLSLPEKGRLIDALVAYADREETEPLKGNERFAFRILAERIDNADNMRLVVNLANEAIRQYAESLCADAQKLDLLHRKRVEAGRMGAAAKHGKTVANVANLANASFARNAEDLPEFATPQEREVPPRTPLQEKEFTPPTTQEKNNGVVDVNRNQSSAGSNITTAPAHASENPQQIPSPYGKAWSYFRSKIFHGTPPQTIWEEMFPYLRLFSDSGGGDENADDVVICACEQAQIYAGASANWPYVRSVLEAWKKKKIFKANEIKALCEKHRQTASSANSRREKIERYKRYGDTYPGGKPEKGTPEYDDWAEWVRWKHGTT